MSHVGGVQLLADVAMVALHRIRRYAEDAGNIVGRFTVCAPLQEFALPRRQGLTLLGTRFAFQHSRKVARKHTAYS